MGLGATITTIVAKSTAGAPLVNTNFSNINGVASLNPTTTPFVTFSSDGGLIQSDGNGNLQWGGGLGSATYLDLYDGTSDTVIFKTKSQATAGTIHFQVPTGTDIVTATGSGWAVQVGNLTLTTGSLKRSAPFSGTGGGAYFNHNLGAVPSLVLLSTVNTSVQRIGYIASLSGTNHMTSTQVYVNADGGFAWWGWAVKF